MDLRYLEFVYFVRSMFGNWNSRNFFFFLLLRLLIQNLPILTRISKSLSVYLYHVNKWVNEYS